MQVGDTVLSEVTQVQRARYCMLSLTSRSDLLIFIYVYLWGSRCCTDHKLEGAHERGHHVLQEGEDAMKWKEEH